ncbi:MAG: AAA family ATPase [Planctomycetota bacterium]
MTSAEESSQAAPGISSDDLDRVCRPLHAVFDEVRRIVLGQDALCRSLLVGLLADGHVLLEGLPGLAKSLAVQSLATAVGGSFRRLQFTPDLLPADLLGTQVYNPQSGEWSTRRGPVFANFVLADEINRAPAKVQSALLEAMQERQVSLAGDTTPLPEPFLVLATQNPIEQEGTYPLPEAQVDRFLLKVVVDYPSREHEDAMVEQMASTANKPRAQNVASADDILTARELVDRVHVADAVRGYAIDLVRASRDPEEAGIPELASILRTGASPRASIGLILAARATALLDGRDYTTPDDVRTIAREVLRHRLILSYEAQARDVSTDDAVDTLLRHTKAP